MNLDPKTMKMKINITQKAMEILHRAKKIELYIERFIVSDCCVPISTPPSVRKGRPRKPENFYAFNVDGIIVYYDRNLISKAELTIDAQEFGFIKGLIVSDWVIRY